MEREIAVIVLGRWGGFGLVIAAAAVFYVFAAFGWLIIKYGELPLPMRVWMRIWSVIMSLFATFLVCAAVVVLVLG